MTTNLNPSIAGSWLAWRSRLTYPDKKPFSVLVERHDLEYPFTQEQLYDVSGGNCPYCTRDEFQGLVRMKRTIYQCLCQVLGHQDQIEKDNDLFRTPVRETYAKEIKIPSGYNVDQEKDLRKAIQNLKRFIANPVRWLHFSGNFGSGKTMFGRIINTAFSPVACYLSAKDLEHHIHSYRKTDDLGMLYQILSVAPILILDDIGAEYGGQLLVSTMTHILDRRYERYPELPTVTITNLDQAGLRAYVPRIADRLLDKERVAYTKFPTKSFRSLTKGERL